MKKMLPINIAATVGLVFVIANSDTLYSAIKGHTTDIVERVTVEDETVAGLAVAYGDFRENDPGNDAAHWVEGSVSVIWDELTGKHYIQLEENFQAGLAPDLYVYVSMSDTPIVDEETFFASTQIELGKLTKGSGASVYELPDNVLPTQVTIWCKRFSQFMGSTTL